MESNVSNVASIHQFGDATSEERKNTNVKSNESMEWGKLFDALCKAQLEMEESKNENINIFFKSKYSDLASIIRASRPALAKNGLCVIQQVLDNAEGIQFLHTKLCHSSGQWIESRIRIAPMKTDVQSLGSYITYLRRYSYAAIVGVVSSDEDDDGNAACPQHSNKQAKASISEEQYKELTEVLDGHDDLYNTVVQRTNLKDLRCLPEEKFEPIMSWIKKVLPNCNYTPPK